MGANSAIEWTDHTFNPWMGCTKVSDGCKHCYAETMMDHRYGKVQWGPQGQRVRTSDANWRKPLAWDKQAAKAGKRARVFCASLADVFEDNPQVEMWRFDLWDLIEATPNLDWLLLTKRLENVFEFTRRWSRELPQCLGHWPPNVWLGTSVENQEQADKRIPHLLRIPAAVRFLSMEPLLGAVDLQLSNSHRSVDGVEFHGSYRIGIDWVIVGGESGGNARPMHPDWARSLRDQCQAAGVPFFFKQWDGRMKKAGGRLLDQREWNEFPEPARA